MGKKNRRRAPEKAREKTRGPKKDERVLEAAEGRLVDHIEERYQRWPCSWFLPPNEWKLLVKHRFGGLSLTRGNLNCVKISAGIVREIRRDRDGTRRDSFEGEKEIWDAWNSMALDEDDGLALDDYIGAVVGLQFAHMVNYKRGLLVAKFLKLDLNTVKRWPRVRPHWRRFQRRRCHNCPACAHLGEPRYMVCSGCGAARYCSEECQRLHWPQHQKKCLAVQAFRAKRKAREAAELEAHGMDTER